MWVRIAFTASLWQVWLIIMIIKKTIMTMQLVSIEEIPCIGERHAGNTGLPVNTKSKFHGVGGNSEKWTLKITLV